MPDQSISSFSLPIESSKCFFPSTTASLQKPLLNANARYEDVTIASLSPGSFQARLTGRIVNIIDRDTHVKLLDVQGTIRLIVKDDTAPITVVSAVQNLFAILNFASWTTQTFHSILNTAIPSAPLTTSIFPEQENSPTGICLIDDNEHALQCRTPLDLDPQDPSKRLSNLFSLSAFLDSNNDIADAQILVYVKSIGKQRNVTTRSTSSSGMSSPDTSQTGLASIAIADETATCTLNLWGALAPSAINFRSSITHPFNPTILLLTNPWLRRKPDADAVGEHKTVSIIPPTFVDVDPECYEAYVSRLFLQRGRNYIQNLKDIDSQDETVIKATFDLTTFMKEGNRTLFTLAGLDECIRDDPHGAFVGYLPVIVLEFHLSELHESGQLMIGQCCNVCVSSSTAMKTCATCEEKIFMSLNPKVVGRLVDETGCLERGALKWSQAASHELLGEDLTTIIDDDGEEGRKRRRWIDERIRGIRVTLIVGWKTSFAGGRICVLGVRM